MSETFVPYSPPKSVPFLNLYRSSVPPPISPFATSTYEITASQPGVYIFGATDGTCGSVTYIKTGKKTARLIFISSIYSTTFRDEYVLTFRTRKSGKYEYYRNSTFYEKGRFKFVDRDKF